MKNIDKRRFKIKKAPLPAKKNPFHRGNITREATEAIAMAAITIHIMVSTVFFFAMGHVFI